MAKVLEGLYYSESHEYVRVEGEFGYIGITDYAQHALGNVTYIDIEKEEEEEVEVGEEFGVLETQKSAEPLFSPVSGTVVEVNEVLDGHPELLHEDAYAHWIIKVELTDKTELDQLMDAEAYQEHCKE
ncbi:MAG: glycine cleavage system protein GcvH [Prevotella sp.]|jgi:glycine cleavage system H protein|nr:glycine cleavage system protein GcvH [Prevotella sp.]